MSSYDDAPFSPSTQRMQNSVTGGLSGMSRGDAKKKKKKKTQKKTKNKNKKEEKENQGI